ncbi:hypothetical protein ACXYMX_06370 [Sporosarcina sp. CAU 1771]
MKNIIKIVGIVVVSTIATLFILGKMGIVNFDMPILDKGFENGKVVLKIDEVSKLSKLEYPRIGQDMNKAYSMFRDVAFESGDQVDFYLLGDRQKIFVNYDPDTNRIDAMGIYVEGDISEIRSIGEKMLPFSNYYLYEESYSTEERNELARYTKIHDVSEYYYELPEQSLYGLITISRSTNDLFGKVDPSSNEDYKIEVSFVGEENIGLNHSLNGSADGEPVNPEVTESSTEQGFENENTSEYYYGENTNDIYYDDEENEVQVDAERSADWEVSEKPIVRIDEDLLYGVGLGLINGINVYLGENIEDVISRLGEPIIDHSIPAFGTVSLGYDGYVIQGAEVNGITVNNSIIQPMLSMEEVKEELGEPIEEWRSRDYLHMYYKVGNYYLNINFNEEGTEIDDISLEGGVD